MNYVTNTTFPNPVAINRMAKFKTKVGVKSKSAARQRSVTR